jgi:hypothetical protein
MTTNSPVAALRLWLAVVFCAAVPLCVHAQGPATRAAEIAREQEEKAANLRPYRQNPVERRLLEIEEAGGLGVIRGWFVAFGDIKQGSSVALGPAYSKLFDSGGQVVGKAVYSIRNFKLVQVAATAPPLAGGRVQISGRARWQDAPRLAVFPLGPGSAQIRADYAESKTEVSGQAILRPVRFIRLGGGAAFERFDTRRADTAHPSIEDLYTPEQMPGLGADPDYVHTFVTAALDSRAGAGYSRSGTLLEATLHDYNQRNAGPYSFQRVDAIARQLIPILRGNWVLDLSVRTSTTTVDAGQQVPFFLMPDLGGSGELRGYSAYRFRDRHSIIFTGEYRWYVQEYVDMAIFYDAGKVVSRRGDLDFDHLKSNVGVGIRFHGPRTTLLRIEVARGSEETRLIFSFGAPIR